MVTLTCPSISGVSVVLILYQQSRRRRNVDGQLFFEKYVVPFLIGVMSSVVGTLVIEVLYTFAEATYYLLA